MHPIQLQYLIEDRQRRLRDQYARPRSPRHHTVRSAVAGLIGRDVVGRDAEH